ncbi:unnamed protein product [marine sediment metagenome]|uniref:Uncharacterized protein n=1 Tax=marine sediment metagenome TaxID=412755 RepID=X1PFP0_9ZZZZ
MPKYKIKPEFLEIGSGLISSFLPQISEATAMAKELGFESPPRRRFAGKDI